MTNTKTQKDFAATINDQNLFRLVGPADFRKSNKENGTRVYLQVEHYDKETGKTTYPVMSALIDQDKPHFLILMDEKFYASLEKGQLLFIDYKVSEKYNSIMSIFKHDTQNRPC